jgi:hypothetical protein
VYDICISAAVWKTAAYVTVARYMVTEQDDFPDRGAVCEKQKPFAAEKGDCPLTK